MATEAHGGDRNLSELARFFRVIMGPERGFYALTIVYGIGISVLSLAFPISVQMLINTVAYTGLVTPLVVLTLTLFGLLLLAGLLNALRIHLMDVFGRRFYARMVSEVALRAIYAVNPFFEDIGRGALFNRYFDIMVVIRITPDLLVGGFTILLQALVGFVLVSFYHPLFLAFNLVAVGAIWVVWLIWGRRAMQSAVELSHRKHATAAWLEGLGGSNGFFKSERHIDDALQHTEFMISHYIEQHILHFRHYFSQTVSYIVIYAVASALLLGLGGWLVIQEQLSLGQLVAAELVLSVVFVGISQLGIYLSYFYDLCGAVDELSLFYGVEQEELLKEPLQLGEDNRLAFEGVLGEERGMTARLTFSIPAGSRTYVLVDGHASERIVGDLLKGHEKPKSGIMSLGGIDLMMIPQHTLRQYIIVLDRPNVTEMTIREYLRLSDEGGRPEILLEVIDAVGLRLTIQELEHGLDTRIADTGWPLTIAETMQLKLASALIARPRVVVLNQLYDVLPLHYLEQSFELLAKLTDGRASVLYFSHRPPDGPFDRWLTITPESQRLHESSEEMQHELDALMSIAVRTSGGPSLLGRN